MTDADVIGLLIAALGGAAVGIERQWSGHADGPRARFAGIRTFTLIGGLGAIACLRLLQRYSEESDPVAARSA